MGRVVKINLIIIIIISVSAICSIINEPKLSEDYWNDNEEEQIEMEPPPTIKEFILLKSKENGINPNTALRIATCESGLDPAAKNSHSSATGLYQFLDSTWENIGATSAGLDRTNPEHSINMFMKYYPIHPGWWECK